VTVLLVTFDRSYGFVDDRLIRFQLHKCFQVLKCMRWWTYSSGLDSISTLTCLSGIWLCFGSCFCARKSPFTARHIEGVQWHVQC